MLKQLLALFLLVCCVWTTMASDVGTKLKHTWASLWCIETTPVPRVNDQWTEPDCHDRVLNATGNAFMFAMCIGGVYVVNQVVSDRNLF